MVFTSILVYIGMLSRSKTVLHSRLRVRSKVGSAVNINEDDLLIFSLPNQRLHNVLTAYIHWKLIINHSTNYRKFEDERKLFKYLEKFWETCWDGQIYQRTSGRSSTKIREAIHNTFADTFLRNFLNSLCWLSRWNSGGYLKEFWIEK